MRLSLIVGSLLALVLVGCSEQRIKPEDQYAQNLQATREWLRGPMMNTCAVLPGPESRNGCSMTLQRMLAQLRGEVLTRDDHFRIELARAKGVDEAARLWSRTQQEAWLREPRTEACGRAPLPDQSRQCLDGVETDLDLLSGRDEHPVERPEVRAERAVARIEARERQRATDQERAHEMDLVRQQAVGQALMGLGMGGFFRNTMTPAPAVQPVPTPGRPSASCTSQHMGQTTYTDCY